MAELPHENHSQCSRPGVVVVLLQALGWIANKMDWVCEK